MTNNSLTTFEASQIMEKASRVVLIWSPWWLKFLEKVEFNYSKEYNRITGLSSMIFLVDTDFIAKSSIMEVAVALEYALQQASRRIDVRVHSMKNHYQNADYSLISLACSLEINSDIEYKFSQFTQTSWSNLVKTKIDNSYIDTYNVRNKPSLPTSSYTYESFGFPPELTAERYLELLLELDDKREREWLDKNDKTNSTDSTDNTSDSTDSTDNTSDSTDSTDNTSDSTDNTSDSTYDGTSDSTNSTDNTSDSTYDGTSDSTNSTISTDNASDSTNSTDGTSNASNASDASDASNASDGTNSTDGTSNASDGTNSTDGTSNASNDSNASDASSSTNNLNKMEYPSNNINSEFVPLDKELRKNSDEIGIHQMTIPEKPKRLSDTIGASESEKNQLEKMLAKEVDDFIEGKGDYENSGISGGLGLSKSFIEWKNKKLRVPKTSWKKELPRMLNKTTGKAMLSGMTDLSFSKRNPNQQENSPLMMGLITYPPTVNIIIDASPSMSDKKESVLSEFIGIVSHFYMTYGEPIGIIVADNGIKYYKRAATVSRHIKKVVSRTYLGGSRGSGNGDGFGDTMKKVMRGKARSKGAMIPKADITIVFTDGGFDWPYPNNGRLPSSVGEVIIVCTTSHADLKNATIYTLPRWVKNKKNFIAIN